MILSKWILQVKTTATGVKTTATGVKTTATGVKTTASGVKTTAPRVKTTALWSQNYCPLESKLLPLGVIFLGRKCCRKLHKPFSKSERYNGIDLLGSSGKKSLTNSVLRILEKAGLANFKGSNHHALRNHAHNQTQYEYGIPTYNRFAQLSSQGNC